MPADIDNDAPSHASPRWIHWAGLFAGPALAVVTWLLLSPGHDAAALNAAGRATAAVAVLMAIWWLTEAIPLSATALLPLALFPVLGILPFPKAANPYASDVIFLFMGGFILGLAMQRWGLHKRIALLTITLVGTGPKRLVGGFMLATALISMWVSNTASTIMMLPIALSVITLVRARHAPPGTPEADLRSPDPNFDSTLLLGVAYAASIGGVATLIGTPTNAIFKGFVESNLGRAVQFVDWMTIGVPIVAIYLPLAWIYLTSISQPIRLKSIPGGRDLIRHELAALGPMSRGEWTVLSVFLATVAAWILRPSITAWATSAGFNTVGNLNDASIAIIASLVLFVFPIEPRKRIFAMDWRTAEQLPWGALLLFGGGLSLAAAISANGVDAYVGRAFQGLDGLPVWLIIMLVVAAVVFLSELASNTAVATAILPVLAAAAPSLGVDPIRLLVPATLASSLAFMLPVGTPPNTIVYATGHTTVRQMVRTGFWLNILAILVITVLAELLWRFVVPA